MTMRPTTPSYNFAQQAGPSSPPATPTTTAGFDLNSSKQPPNRRHGMIHPFSRPLHTQPELDGTITPNGDGFTFSYNRFQVLDLEQLSPRSSSPASSRSSSPSAASTTPSLAPRSRSSSPEASLPNHTDHGRLQVPPQQIRRRIVAEGNFTLEDFKAEDYETFNSDAESTILPHQYEDAESDRARSAVGGSSPTRPSHAHTHVHTRTRTRELDPTLMNGLHNLHCPSDSESDISLSASTEEREREAWLAAQREEKRRKRRSSGSVQKRTHAQSVGSGTDDEDVLPILDGGVNEVGSSARRMRRRVGDRASLVFEDPPACILEVEEPESCVEGEERIGVVGEVEEEEGQGVDRELPYFVWDMEVDPDED